MDKAVVLGAFGFLGYSLSKALLDEGVEVTAQWLDVDPFIEEKRLEIGRNANFIETEDESWVHEKRNNQKKIPVIIPVYDLYIQKAERVLFEELDLFNMLSSLSPENFTVALLLPEQFIYEEDASSGLVVELKQLLNENGFSYQEIFLPTLFGPWQPAEYFFQQLMSLGKGEGSTLMLNSRESLSDAIFIDDATLVISELISQRPGKYVVRSSKVNNWANCLERLCNHSAILDICDSDDHWKKQIDKRKRVETYIEKLVNEETEYKLVFITKPLENDKGIKKQRDHYDFLGQSRC
ncbi:hypothetical protein SAMN05192533_109170 [Mesobacillus persicus]|uniref:Nucleoside-diphosphate-sugar epimerase n=1 Tax=Mesobacillus persicus TaxID=930146 RepID=A0A1H8E5Y1_9BACI|nr:hypothetical protein [Mesobacillus persicus]SEN14820.1 hypothetical protein SAMN05192533_109170 [Mesobacillus persicus]